MKCKRCGSDDTEEVLLITQCYHIDEISFTDDETWLCYNCGKISKGEKRRR